MVVLTYQEYRNLNLVFVFFVFFLEQDNRDYINFPGLEHPGVFFQLPFRRGFSTNNLYLPSITMSEFLFALNFDILFSSDFFALLFISKTVN